MVEWFLNNKEWLFSGIGVSSLLGIIYLIRYIIKRRVVPESIITQSDKPLDSVFTNTQTDQRIVSMPANLHSEKEYLQKKSISHINPHEIYEAVRILPPLQQDIAFQNYVGLRVDWTGNLYFAHIDPKDSSVIRLGLIIERDEIRSDYIHFDVNSDENRELAIAKTGTPIRVVGEIKKVDPSWIDLTNCILTILPKSSNQNQ